MPGSHFVHGCPAHHSVVVPDLERIILWTTDKLRVLVRVDLDCAKAQVAAQGHVTSKSIRGLSYVMKRANSLTAGMTLELDMTRALIEPEALEELRTYSGHPKQTQTHPSPQSLRRHLLPVSHNFRVPNP